jgi:hypothetical protein
LTTHGTTGRNGGGRRRWRSRLVAIAAASLLYAPAARAQDVTEPALKAAYIYNFAKFTDWPADALPAAAPFNACVLGDDSLGDALERTVSGRHLSGRVIHVVRVRLDSAMRSCHLLYVSGVTGAQIETIAALVRDAPVLTISDADDFARVGIAQLFLESGKMAFKFNLEVARRSRLQLSSRLLVLAAHVHDGPGTAPR